MVIDPTKVSIFDGPPTSRIFAILKRHFPTHENALLCSVADLIHKQHSDALEQEKRQKEERKLAAEAERLAREEERERLALSGSEEATRLALDGQGLAVTSG